VCVKTADSRELMMRQSALSLTLAVVSAALLGGCSSGGATSATSAATPTAAETNLDESGALKKAVTAYSVAFLSGDGSGAFALLSSRCKARLSEDEMRSETEQAKNTYGQLPIKTYALDNLSGDLARVSYTYSAPDINQTKEPWVREGGRWLEDDC
jgi:hypothetical protein